MAILHCRHIRYLWPRYCICRYSRVVPTHCLDFFSYYFAQVIPSLGAKNCTNNLNKTKTLVCIIRIKNKNNHQYNINYFIKSIMYTSRGSSLHTIYSKTYNNIPMISFLTNNTLLNLKIIKINTNNSQQQYIK